MKKNMFIIFLIISLASCSTLDSLVNSMVFAEGESETNQGQNSNSSESEAGAQNRSTSSDSGSEMTMDFSAFLSPELQFSLFYASYFFLGGYGFGDDNFRDGEGVQWSVSTNSDNKEILITRAKLKTLANGNVWWYFSTEVDDDEYYYEMLVENDYDLLKVRYKNSSTGGNEEFIPETDQDNDDESIETLSMEIYNQFKVGSETVKTGAGSFKTDHIVLRENESELIYEYWVADRAPGHLVKYRYENKAENQIMTGEITDIRGGYKTRLESY